MPKVMLEMEMPKSCDTCRFGIVDKSKPSVWCSANQKMVTGARLINGKLENCPLQEVKE